VRLRKPWWATAAAMIPSSAESKARCAPAQDRAASLIGGLARINTEIAGVELEIEQIIDRRCRSETAAAVAAMIERFDKAAAHAAAALEYEQRAKGWAFSLPRALFWRTFY
jgi:hypothetical protein